MSHHGLDIWKAQVNVVFLYVMRLLRIVITRKLHPEEIFRLICQVLLQEMW